MMGRVVRGFGLGLQEINRYLSINTSKVYHLDVVFSFDFNAGAKKIYYDGGTRDLYHCIVGQMDKNTKWSKKDYIITLIKHLNTIIVICHYLKIQMNKKKHINNSPLL